jgi:hypothetical protein
VEIGQFLRSRPRAVALAALIPLVAGLVTSFVLWVQPARHTATATVSVPGSAADSASRVGIFVANFTELASSGPVLAEVADSTGESQKQLQDGLEVLRLGQSSLFTVTYTGERRDTVEPVVRAVISTTFGDLVQVSGTDAALKAADQACQDALAARTAYQDEIGTLQPDRDYADLSARIRSLQIEPRFGSAAAIARLTEERQALVPEIRRMEELDQAVAAAATQRAEAEEAAASARRDAAESQSPNTVQALTVAEESPVGRLIQGVGVAVVAGLLLGLAVLLLPDLFRRRSMPLTSVARHSAARPRSAAAVRDAS